MKQRKVIINQIVIKNLYREYFFGGNMNSAIEYYQKEKAFTKSIKLLKKYLVKGSKL